MFAEVAIGADPVPAVYFSSFAGQGHQALGACAREPVKGLLQVGYLLVGIQQLYAHGIEEEQVYGLRN